MNLDRIRKMNDDELRKFINTISKRGSDLCIKCDIPLNCTERKTINIGIYSSTSGQKIRKLCSLCNECYIDLLDYLGVSDIDWGE